MSPPIAWSGPEELETVQRHGIKLLICIINDGGY
jgi:thiamine pyrophosphate-dependent acetolactate synthase large subunit-like protein